MTNSKREIIRPFQVIGRTDGRTGGEGSAEYQTVKKSRNNHISIITILMTVEPRRGGGGGTLLLCGRRMPRVRLFKK